MYGFGDVKSPDDDTVAVMEEIAVEYMTEMVTPNQIKSPLFVDRSRFQTRKAIKVNGRPGKIETQDIVFLIRRDAKKVLFLAQCSTSRVCAHSRRKVDRVRELIRMRQQLQEMRKLTDVSGGAPN